MTYRYVHVHIISVKQTVNSPNHLLPHCQMTMLAHQGSPPPPPHCLTPQKFLCVYVHFSVWFESTISMYTVCRHVT